MRKLKISSIIFFAVLLSGCGGRNFTPIYFESYNQLENPVGEYQSGGEFTFEANNKRYDVMDGYAAEEIRIIGEDKENIYKLIMFSIKLDGIGVVASVPDDESEYGYRDIILSDMKYTDQPIESE